MWVSMVTHILTYTPQIPETEGVLDASFNPSMMD